jgi:hypothetical protein
MDRALELYKDYQARVPEIRRFDGIHLDIEFHADHPEWNDKDKQTEILTEYLALRKATNPRYFSRQLDRAVNKRYVISVKNIRKLCKITTSLGMVFALSLSLSLSLSLFER